MAGTLPNGVRRERGGGGLERITVARPSVGAEIYLHGATATRWTPAGHEPVLWLSERAIFQAGAAIRGGIPICFPWFGPKADDRAAPQHGFARTSEWQLEEVREHGDSIEIAFTLSSNDASRARWPHRFVARYAVLFGAKLELDLTVHNRDEHALSFEAALHAYFAVEDVADVRITGLEGKRFVDKVAGGVVREDGDRPLALTGETDRVYLGATGGCEIVDPRAARRITVQTDGANNLVVWNPWLDKARAMKDLGEDPWSRMLCVEPANVLSDAVALAPGRSHTMRARIVVNAGA